MFEKVRQQLSVIFFAAVLAVSVIPAQNLRLGFLQADEENAVNGISIEQLSIELSKNKNFEILDHDLSEAVKRASAYENLFNLSRLEAKNLGAAIGCNYYFIIRSRLQRRSSSAKAVYFEAFAVVFLVHSKSGRLIYWERPAFEDEKIETAQKMFLSALPALAARFGEKIRTTQISEQTEKREKASEEIKPPTVEVPETEAELKVQNFRIPLPYKSLRPAYTEAAAKDDTEAKVDILVEIDETGTVRNAEIERWAGFGLDEEALATVKKLQFRAALRDAKPIAVKFILRYNFRRLPLEKKD
jgi:TonB family protein